LHIVKVQASGLRRVFQREAIKENMYMIISIGQVRSTALSSVRIDPSKIKPSVIKSNCLRRLPEWLVKVWEVEEEYCQ